MGILLEDIQTSAESPRTPSSRLHFTLAHRLYFVEYRES